jgi:hypothetical protein
LLTSQSNSAYKRRHLAVDGTLHPKRSRMTFDDIRLAILELFTKRKASFGTAKQGIFLEFKL